MQEETGLPLDPESVEVATLLNNQDPRVLEHLNAYAELLRKILAKKYPWLSEEDIIDIIQDTLLQVYRKGKDYNPAKKGIKSWLILQADFVALTLLRKRRMIDARHPSIDGLEDRFLVSPNTIYCEGTGNPSPAMEKLIQQLSPKRAMVIRLYYYEHESISNIAKRLNVTEGTVRSHLSLAQKDLRQLAKNLDKEVQ